MNVCVCMCIYTYIAHGSWAPCALCRCLCPTYSHTFIPREALGQPEAYGFAGAYALHIHTRLYLEKRLGSLRLTALRVPMPYIFTHVYIPTYLIHGCSCMYLSLIHI